MLLPRMLGASAQRCMNCTVSTAAAILADVQKSVCWYEVGVSMLLDDAVCR